MSTRSQLAILVSAGLLWLPGASRAQDRQLQEATAAAAAELPAGLAQVPAGQAVVTYVQGQLTIKASNARLIDVLREACRQIGADLDVHASANEPILGVVGPGSAAEVLTSLLGNSQVDYALARSAGDASVLALVLIYPKATDPQMARATSVEMAKATDAGTAKATDPAVAKATAPTIPQHLTELFGAAKAEIASASYTPSDSQNEDASGAEADVMTALQADPGILKQIEDKINAAAEAKPSDNANPNPPQQPAGAVRHRGRH
jgi:hypothetical protein